MLKLFKHRSSAAPPPARPPPRALSLSPEQLNDPAFSSSPDDNPYAAHGRTDSSTSTSSFVVVRKPHSHGPAPAPSPRKSAEENSSGESADSRSSAETVTPPTSADCHDSSSAAGKQPPSRSADIPLVTVHPSRSGQTVSQPDMPSRERRSPPRSDTSNTRPSAPPRSTTAPAPPKPKALDSIDELDESNMFGVNLHNGGPYDAIRKAVKKASSPPSNGNAVPFGASLNLSPGQVLPHNFHPYAPYHSNVTPSNIDMPAKPPPRANFFPSSASAPGQKEATGLHRDDPYALATHALHQPELPPTTALQRAAGIDLPPTGNGQPHKRRGSEQPPTWNPPMARRPSRPEVAGPSLAAPAPRQIPRMPSAPKLPSAMGPPAGTPIPRPPSTPANVGRERLPSRTPPPPMPPMPHANTAPIPSRSPPTPTSRSVSATASSTSTTPTQSSSSMPPIPGPSRTPPGPSRTPPANSRTPPPPARAPKTVRNPSPNAPPPAYDEMFPPSGPSRPEKTGHLTVPEREQQESEPSEYGDEEDAYGGMEDTPPAIPASLLPGGGAQRIQQAQPRRWSEQPSPIVQAGALPAQQPRRVGVNHGLFEQRVPEPGAQHMQRAATVTGDPRAPQQYYPPPQPTASGFMRPPPPPGRGPPNSFTQYPNTSRERVPMAHGPPPSSSMPMPERRDRRVSEPWGMQQPSQYAPSVSTSSSGMPGRPRPSHVPQRLVMPSPLGGGGPPGVHPPPRTASIQQARFVPPQHLPASSQGPPPARSHMQHQHLRQHGPPSMQPAPSSMPSMQRAPPSMQPAPPTAAPIARSQSSRLFDDDRKLRKKGSAPPPRHESLPPVSVDLGFGRAAKVPEPAPPPKKRVLSKKRGIV
ncbi:hypothetical protein EV122DRAFT_291040 [Schizophyllum commune]